MDIAAQHLNQGIAALCYLVQVCRIAKALKASRTLPDHPLADSSLLPREHTEEVAVTVRLEQRIDIILQVGQPPSLFVLSEIDVLNITADDLRPREVLRDQKGGVVHHVRALTLISPVVVYCE